MIQASAPAKIILCGEHAVVYGYPAIAVPVPALRAVASVTQLESGESLRFNLKDLNQKITWYEKHYEPVIAVTQRILDALGKEPPSIEITVESTIPIASGLGSGAAVSTAIARALIAYFQQDVSRSTLNQIVYDIEKMHHGTPSGIDNTVVVYEQPVYFVREHPIETLSLANPLHLLIADTGISALTKESVGDVRKLYDAKPDEITPILESIGTIVKNIRTAMHTGDIVRTGQLMNVNHQLLSKLTVSSPLLDKLVDTAIDAGAYGAKLSGGGRGGNMIALVNDDTALAVKQALLANGTKQVFETLIPETNT